MLLVLALAGCAGDGSTSEEGVTTGLPDDRVLADVTIAEAQTLCDSIAETSAIVFGAAEQARLACTIVALSSRDVVMSDGMRGATTDRAACEESVNACLATSPVPTETDLCDAGNVTIKFAQCAATAAELEACLNALQPEIESLAAQFNCDLDLDNGPPTTLKVPAVCGAFEMKCPDALGAVGVALLPDIDLSGATGNPGGSGP